jgi:hypothetical protein
MARNLVGLYEDFSKGSAHYAIRKAKKKLFDNKMWHHTRRMSEEKLDLYVRFREDEIQKIYDINREYFYNLESSIENILAEHHCKQFLKLHNRTITSKENSIKRKILHKILYKEKLEKERENIFTLIENISKDFEGKEIIKEHEIYGEDLLLLILRNLYFN